MTLEIGGRIGHILIAADIHNDENKDADNKENQNSKKCADGHQTLMGFGLFRIDILLKRLKNRKIVHCVLVAVKCHRSRIRGNRNRLGFGYFLVFYHFPVPFLLSHNMCYVNYARSALNLFWIVASYPS